METIVIISVVLITISHRLMLQFRKTGAIPYETAYDIFSLVMYITVFVNLYLLFQWIGLLVAVALIFVGGIISIPAGFCVYKTDMTVNELTAVFAILSWVNIGITIVHLIVSLCNYYK